MNIQSIKQKATPIFEQYRVRKASIFGSVVRGEDTSASDIDFLLELPKEASLFDVVALKADLEESLNSRVDLVEYDVIKPKLRKNIIESSVPIYSI